MDPDSEELTTFHIRYGAYKCKVLWEGLTNRPAVTSAISWCLESNIRIPLYYDDSKLKKREGSKGDLRLPIYIRRAPLGPLSIRCEAGEP